MDESVCPPGVTSSTTACRSAGRIRPTRPKKALRALVLRALSRCRNVDVGLDVVFEENDT